MSPMLHFTPVNLAMFVVAALIVAGVGVMHQQRQHRPSIEPETLIILLGAVLLVANGLEISGTTLTTKVFWTQIQFAAFVLLPPLWVILGAEFARLPKPMIKWLWVWLSIEPLVMIVLGFTTQTHGLVAYDFQLETVNGIMRLTRTNGVILWFHAAYAYVLVTAGIFLLTRMVFRSGRLYRRQVGALLVSALLAAMASVFDLLDIRFYGEIKFMPLTMAPSTLLIWASSVDLWRADVLPISRETIVETVEDCILVLDLEDRIMDANLAAEVLIGHPLKDVIGRTVGEIWPEWVAPLSADTGISSNDNQLELCLGHDPARMLEGQSSELNDWRGRPVGVVIVLRDITERKLSAVALQESEQRYRAVIEHIQVGIFLVDALSKQILEANPAFHMLLGYERSEMMALPLDVLLNQPEDRIEAHIQRVIVNGQTHFGEYRCRRQDGVLIDMEIHGSLIAYSGTDVICMVAHDITQRKRVANERRRRREELETQVTERTAELRAANERLEALSRAKDEFVSNVSHELRTPLTTLKLRQHMMQINPEQATAVHLPAIQRETKRLERTIEDLLYLSRLDQDRTQVRLQGVNLNDIVSQYVADLTVLVERRELRIAFIAHAGLPLVQVDRGLMVQVLSILLTNAMNYTPTGGNITVGTQLQGQEEGEQMVGFYVHDTGPGIAPDEQPRLFERFFRGDVGRSSKVPGTGLGLAIAKEIIDRHQGEIELISEGIPGKGLTVNVWLPANDSMLDSGGSARHETPLG